MNNYFGLVLKISRPRFWLYLAGPFLLGAAAGSHSVFSFFDSGFIFLFLYFLIPANVLVYGINDFFDVETDSLNVKKTNYEYLVKINERKILIAVLFISLVISFLNLYFLSQNILRWIFGLFLFLGVFYSSPPIRFKARPFFDFMSNSLYAMPGIIGYIYFSSLMPDLFLVASAFLWCFSMHLFSAVPDIAPDKKARINTSAVFLGEKKSLFTCFIFWFTSWFLLIFKNAPFPVLLILSVYPLMVFLVIIKKISPDALYRKMPLVNSFSGFVLFLFLSGLLWI